MMMKPSLLPPIQGGYPQELPKIPLKSYFALRPHRRPASSRRGSHFSADHHAMTSAMALDALNPSVQPSAVTLLAGYRYSFIHAHREVDPLVASAMLNGLVWLQTAAA